MLSLAKQRAQEIIERWQTNDPYFIAEKENIDVVDHLLSGRLKELYFGDHIILNKKMSYTQKRHYLAHALGHHYLHTGNQLFFAQNRYMQNDKEESQAEEFAAHLLIPTDKLQPVLDWNIEDLSNHFQVTPKFIQYRLNLIANN